MTHILHSAALAGLLAVSAMPAHAGGFGFGFEDAGVGVELYGGDVEVYGDGDGDNGRWAQRGGWMSNRCTPERALRKAERFGLRRTHVTDVDRRTIEVTGRKHREWVTIVFARAPHCPILDW